MLDNSAVLHQTVGKICDIIHNFDKVNSPLQTVKMSMWEWIQLFFDHNAYIFVKQFTNVKVYKTWMNHKKWNSTFLRFYFISEFISPRS